MLQWRGDDVVKSRVGLGLVHSGRQGWAQVAQSGFLWQGRCGEPLLSQFLSVAIDALHGV